MTTTPPTDTHALERTSPKGGPFIGYCTKCGRQDLPASAIHDECPNPSGVTQDQAILDAIDTPTPERAEGPTPAAQERGKILIGALVIMHGMGIHADRLAEAEEEAARALDAFAREAVERGHPSISQLMDKALQASITEVHPGELLPATKPAEADAERAREIVDQYPVDEGFDANTFLIEEIVAALSTARAEGIAQGRAEMRQPEASEDDVEQIALAIFRALKACPGDALGSDPAYGFRAADDGLTILDGAYDLIAVARAALFASRAEGIAQGRAEMQEIDAAVIEAARLMAEAHDNIRTDAASRLNSLRDALGAGGEGIALGRAEMQKERNATLAEIERLTAERDRSDGNVDRVLDKAEAQAQEIRRLKADLRAAAKTVYEEKANADLAFNISYKIAEETSLSYAWAKETADAWLCEVIAIIRAAARAEGISQGRAESYEHVEPIKTPREQAMRETIHGQGLSMVAMGKELREKDERIVALDRENQRFMQEVAGLRHELADMKTKAIALHEEKMQQRDHVLRLKFEVDAATKHNKELEAKLAEMREIDAAVIEAARRAVLQIRVHGETCHALVEALAARDRALKEE